MNDHAVRSRGRRCFSLRHLLIGCAFAGGLLLPAIADAQTGANVLVVINTSAPDSIKVGEYYATVRAIPDKNVVRLAAGTSESIPRREYETKIEQPISAWLARHSLQDRVLYVVLAKGVPLKILGTTGRDGTSASVDSELTLLYRKLTGIVPPIVGRVENPYFLGEAAVSEAKPFTRFFSDIYLVTRLDGFTADDAIALIDRAQAPGINGKVLLDQSGSTDDRIADRWLRETANRLDAVPGERALLETSAAPASTTAPVLGLFSWGSNDPAVRRRQAGLQFAKGALAGMFVSTDGRTFVEPPADWVPGTRRGPEDESLAGDLIREGVTGLVANVSEPFLEATVRPQVLFPAYFSGFNLAEAAYLAMPFLGWQGIVIGDPLCSPFHQTTLRPEDIDRGIDAVTELPALFAERRLARLANTGLNLEALRGLLKADARLARDEGATIEPLLRKVVELEPRLTAVSLRLATIHEGRSEYDQAIDLYRKVIAIEPDNVIALNNLAYALAERKQLPQEGLPFAEKAYRLAPVVEIADTVGWIHHLLGDDRTAITWIEKALTSAPNWVELLVHSAIVHGALNDVTKARERLQAAEKLDPKVSERADVKALRIRLKIDPDAGLRPA
jgi:uncharacterized protein (TIGR03790 family)